MTRIEKRNSLKQSRDIFEAFRKWRTKSIKKKVLLYIIGWYFIAFLSYLENLRAI